MSAGLESHVHVRRASWKGPTRRLSLPFATVALDPVSGRPGDGPTAATDEDALLQLALWLAEVTAEATLMATAADAGCTPGAAAPRRARDVESPPVAEPTS